MVFFNQKNVSGKALRRFTARTVALELSAPAVASRLLRAVVLHVTPAMSAYATTVEIYAVVVLPTVPTEILNYAVGCVH